MSRQTAKAGPKYKVEALANILRLDYNHVPLLDRGFFVESYQEFKSMLLNFPLLQYVYQYEHAEWLTPEDISKGEFKAYMLVLVNDE
jgi:hypothetical protein